MKLQAKYKGIGPYTLRTLVFGSNELEAAALHEQQACTWLQKQTQCTHTRMTRCNKAGFSKTPTPSWSAAVTLHIASLLKSPLVFLSHFLLFLRSKVILQEHTLHMKHIAAMHECVHWVCAQFLCDAAGLLTHHNVEGLPDFFWCLACRQGAQHSPDNHVQLSPHPHSIADQISIRNSRHTFNHVCYCQTGQVQQRLDVQVVCCLHSTGTNQLGMD